MEISSLSSQKLASHTTSHVPSQLRGGFSNDELKKQHDTPVFVETLEQVPGATQTSSGEGRNEYQNPSDVKGDISNNRLECVEAISEKTPLIITTIDGLNKAIKDLIGVLEQELAGRSSMEKREEKRAKVVQRVQVEPDRKGWGRLMDLYKEHDENRIKVAKEDIDSLLVFAGLFSAVLSAFVVETYHGLQQDPGDTTNQILLQLSSQLASLSVSNSFINSTHPAFAISTGTFVAQRSSVTVNTLWSFSLAASLITASLGILVKQWLNEFMTHQVQNPQYRVRVRFFRSDGLEKWQVFEIAATLPLLLQLSLLLFFIGFSIFLRELNPIVGWTTTAAFISWLLVFEFTTLAPAVSSQCPYKTPILKGTLQHLRPYAQTVYGSFQRYVAGSIWHISVVLIFGRIRSWPYAVRGFAKKKLESVLRTMITTLGWLINTMWTFFRLERARELLRRGVNQLRLGAKTIRDTLKTTLSRLLPPEGSGWIYIPLPEEEKIREAENNDLDIILVSDSFFLDEQISRTLTECTEGMNALHIMEYYNESCKKPILNAFKPRGWSAIGPQLEAYSEEVRLKLPDKSKCRIEVKEEAKEKLEVIVRNALITRSGNPGQDISWFNLLEFILESGRDAEWWDDLPNFVTKLIRSDLEYGACPAFLAIYSLLQNDAESLPNNLYRCFVLASAQGDVQYLENLIAITTTIYEVIWGQKPAQPSSTYDRILHLIPGGQRDTLDILSILGTFALLTMLVSREIHGIQREDIRIIIAKIWDKHDPQLHPQLLPTGEYFTTIIHVGIEGGSRVPFLQLYSSSTQESFDHNTMCWNSDSQEGDSIQYLNNLISIAKSLMDLFWFVPTNPLSADEHLQGLVEKHGIERDVCAFCYTFSILLMLASFENIAKRKEELREISSRILGILPSEGDTEFVAKSTRTTYKQLALQGFDASRLIGIVDEGLVPKLWELRDKVDEGHNYRPWD